MGTRNLTAVMAGGIYKVAQYGQWDGYPSGQGAVILDFLLNHENVAKLRNSMANVRFLDPEGVDKEFVDSYTANAPEWSSDPDNRTEDQKVWFRNFITRDLCAKVLHNIIENDGEIILTNAIAFAGDSLMCEYAYVIDLDSDAFEIYEGFNEQPITEGRFTSGDKGLESSSDYGPVKLVKSYSLNSLPDLDTFVSDLESEEE